MRKLYVFPYVLICCFFACPQVRGQIHDLTSVDSATERIEKFFLDADKASECMAFSFESDYARVDLQSSGLDAKQIVGLVVVGRIDSLDVSYVGNQSQRIGSGKISRQESLTISGKQKARAFAFSGDPKLINVASRETPDEHVRLGDDAILYFTNPHPYFLTLLNPGSFLRRTSWNDRIVDFWVSKVDLIQESSYKGKLVATWIDDNKTGKYEITFDSEFGGMPVRLREYTIDSTGKQTREYHATTETAWKKVGTGSHAKWVPSRIRMTDHSAAAHRDIELILNVLDEEESKRLISKVKWKEQFQADKAQWFDVLAEEFRLLSSSVK